MNDGPPLSRTDPTWRPLKSWLLSRRFEAVEELKIVGLSDALANAARGRIALVDKLIRAVEPEKAMTEEQVDFGNDYMND